MPELGEITKGTSIGKVKGAYIWIACDICQKQYWVLIEHNKPRRTICHICSVKTSNKIRGRFPLYTHGDKPQLGDTATAKELGKGGDTRRFIYSACIDCGKQRWVLMIRGKPNETRCFPCGVRTPEHRKRLSIYANSCIGAKHHGWKGGKLEGDYRLIWVDPTDFYHSMARDNKHYVLEHRLVMAKHLKRCLLSWEVVHHKNGIKTDNRIENLELLPSPKYHVADLVLKSRLKYLHKRVLVLEAVLKEHGLPIPKTSHYALQGNEIKWS